MGSPFHATNRPGLPASVKREALVAQLSAALLVLILAGLQLFTAREESPASDLPRLSPFDEPVDVRVRLTKAKIGGRIAGAEGLTLVDLRESGERRDLDEALTVSMNEGAISIGGRTYPSGLEIRARESRLLQLNTHQYPGILRILPDSRRGLVFVLHVPLETYLAFVLPREMPLAYPADALRAQTIAARSYAVATMLDRRSSRWDLVDTEASQVFGGLSRLVDDAEKFVRETEGMIMAYDGQVLPTYYSATCGGHTRDNAAAFGSDALKPLVGVRCGFCRNSRDHRWTTRLDRNKVRRALSLRSIDSIEIVSGERGDRFSEVIFKGRGDEVRESATALRRRFGRSKVRSNWLTKAEVVSGEILLSGRGFGHGVGLCQNGARGLAKAGKNYRSILRHYFPGAHLARLTSP